MILNELSRLERFRRIARNYELPISSGIYLPHQEVEYLRATLNARIYPAAESWMVPSWIYLTLKEINKEEELIARLANTAFNNWSNIGGVGASKYGIVDSRGLLTARFDYGSIDFWLLYNGSIIFPALLGKDDSQLRLVSAEDQLYEWKAHIKSVEFDRLIYHIKKDENEFIYNEIMVQNHNLEKATITFFVAIRPMSVLGFEPIEQAEYDANHLMVFINNYLSLILTKNPTVVIMGENTNKELPNVLLADSTRPDSKTESASGQATVLLRYDITLPPSGSEHIFFVSPLVPITKEDELPSFSPDTQDRDVTIGRWFSFSDNRVDAAFPNEVLDLAFSQATVSLATQAFPVLFPEDSYLASLSWNERIRVLIALVRSGCIDVAKQVSTEIINRIQIPEGNLDLSIFVPILKGLLALSDHSITDFVSTNSMLIRNLTWGVTKSIKPITSAPEEEAPLQSYIIISKAIIEDLIQMLWNKAALTSALTHFKLIKDEEMVQELEAVLKIVLKAIAKLSDDIGNARWLKSDDPSMHEIERTILDFLSTVSLLQVSGLDQSLLELLRDKISRRRIVHNLWKQYQPKEQYSSHLALRLAHYYTMMKQRDKVEPILDRTMEFLAEDYILPEYVNIRSYGGDEGIGASVIAAADLILLLRDILLSEENSNLILLTGVPGDWFTAKKPLVVENLPSKYGPIHIEIGSSANQHQIEVSFAELPEELEFHVPPTVPLPMVKAYGASIVERSSKVSSPFLRVVPHTNEVVLTFHK